MLNNQSRIWLGALWLASAALIAVGSLLTWSTLVGSTLLFVVLMTPLVVLRLIGLDGPPPTVAEVLHAVHTPKDGPR